MIDDLRAMAIFAKAAELKSFRQAAKSLDLAPSVVSHHISRLEERLGVALMYRSTRKLSLTPQGEILLAATRTMVLAAQAGLEAVATQTDEPAGKLRVSAGAALSCGPILDGLSAFAKAYPKVELQVEFTDFPQNLVREGIDLAIRIGNLKDSSLRSQKLFTVKRRLVVAPALRQQNPRPRKPDDLRSWPWIGLTMRPNYRVLVNDKGQKHRVNFVPRMVVDNVAAAFQLAVGGVGIATPPTFLIADALDKGTVIEPLPGWVPEPLNLYGVWPANAPRASLTFLLKNFLAATVYMP